MVKTVAIVSLSRGILGEPFIRHELKIGLNRLESVMDEQILKSPPLDEKYAEEYRKVIVDVVGNPELSIVWNLNVGHATPRCIIPFGVSAMVDDDAQRINFTKQ